MASPEMMHALVKGMRKKKPRTKAKEKVNPYASALMKKQKC